MGVSELLMYKLFSGGNLMKLIVDSSIGRGFGHLCL